MTYKEFKNSEEYRFADILEVYSEKTGCEFDFNFPEEELDKMEVVETSCDGGWVSVTLKG